MPRGSWATRRDWVRRYSRCPGLGRSMHRGSGWYGLGTGTPIERMQPLWIISIREVLYPMAPLAALAVGAIAVTAARMASDHGGPPWFGAVGDHQGRKESRVFRDPDLDCEASAARGDAAASRPPPAHQSRDLPGLRGGIGAAAGFCAMADNRMCWSSRRPAAARAPAW